MPNSYCHLLIFSLFSVVVSYLSYLSTLCVVVAYFHASSFLDAPSLFFLSSSTSTLEFERVFSIFLRLYWNTSILECIVFDFSTLTPSDSLAKSLMSLSPEHPDAPRSGYGRHIYSDFGASWLLFPFRRPEAIPRSYGLLFLSGRRNHGVSTYRLFLSSLESLCFSYAYAAQPLHGDEKVIRRTELSQHGGLKREKKIRYRKSPRTQGPDSGEKTPKFRNLDRKQYRTSRVSAQ